MPQDTTTTGRIGGKWRWQSTCSPLPQDPHYPITYVRHRGSASTVVNTPVKNNPSSVVLCLVIKRAKNIYTPKPKTPQVRVVALLKKESLRAHFSRFLCHVNSAPMSQLSDKLPKPGKKWATRAILICFSLSWQKRVVPTAKGVCRSSTSH